MTKKTGPLSAALPACCNFTPPLRTYHCSRILKSPSTTGKKVLSFKNSFTIMPKASARLSVS